MGLFDRFFDKGNGQPEPKPAPPTAEDLGAALKRVHEAYWTPAPEEKKRLRAAEDGLDWKDLLRLYHLGCLDLMIGAGLTSEAAQTVKEAFAPVRGPDVDWCARLAARLSGPGSPFRSRVAFVYQRSRGDAKDANRPPDQRGALRNASQTHFGALEVIRLDGDRPTVVDFVPFDTLRFVQFSPPSLFPAARLDHEEPSRSEIVRVPLLYGSSWLSPRALDHNGRITRFMCHLGDGPSGMGVGQQDFTTGQNLFGLDSMECIEFPLDMNQPDFDERCRRRGLDPVAIRRDFAARSS